MTEKNNIKKDISEDTKQELLKNFAEHSGCVCYELPEPVIEYLIDEEVEFDPKPSKYKNKDST
ncbi:MAG: hypothetical protein OSJ76_00990 [Alphaproteobacteria bacterium]|nr:hypothetical protein [Alphaproteobacteria bacterium]